MHASKLYNGNAIGTLIEKRGKLFVLMETTYLLLDLTQVGIELLGKAGILRFRDPHSHS